MFVDLSVPPCPTIHRFVRVRRSIRLSIFVDPSVHRSIDATVLCPSIRLSFRSLFHLSFRPIGPSIHLCLLVHPSICVSIVPSVRATVGPSVYLRSPSIGAFVKNREIEVGNRHRSRSVAVNRGITSSPAKGKETRLFTMKREIQS